MIGLATASTLNADASACGWTDRGCVITSGVDGIYNAIDPCPIVDDSGDLWLCFGSFFSGIHLARLDNSTGLRSTGHPDVHLLATRPGVENNPIEAPFLYRRHRFYYLLTSWDYCCRGVESTYHIRVGRSPTIEGPYVDRDGVDLRSGGGSLLLGATDRRLGPGQPSLFTLNEWEYLSYHYYDRADSGRPKLGLATVNWVDDWPVL